MMKTNELATIDDDAQTRLMLLFASGDRLNVPKDTVLFTRGSCPTGAYLINAGRVRLALDGVSERDFVPRLASAGEVLGLDAVFSDRRCEFTATTTTRAMLDFVSAADLMRVLHGDPALFVATLQLLSRDIVAWYDAVRDSREAPLRVVSSRRS